MDPSAALFIEVHAAPLIGRLMISSCEIHIPGPGGGGLPTVTVTERVVVPPAPVQASVYVAVAVGETPWVPAMPLLPLQAPEAVQLVALVLDHVSVLDWPDVIEVGLAPSVTVGSPPPLPMVTALLRAMSV